MKTPIHAVAPLFLLVLLGSCSKEKAEPTGLNDTKWRLTAQTREQYSKGGSPWRSHNGSGCLGLNTLTFAASGQVLWTRETGSCSPYYDVYGKMRGNVWGQWKLNDSPSQLRITPDSKLLFPANYNALPVTINSYWTDEPYEVVELNATTLILSRTHTFPQDSVYISKDTFTRVAE